MALPDWVERGLTWVLAVALVVSVIATIGIALNPPETTDPYTEFYILGPGGNASGYPTNLSTGATGEVIVGISNHEHDRVTYHVVVTWNGTVTKRRSVTVPAGATEQFRMRLKAPQTPRKYKVRLLLYKGEPDGSPYRWLRVWSTVRQEHVTFSAVNGGACRWTPVLTTRPW